MRFGTDTAETQHRVTSPEERLLLAVMQSAFWDLEHRDPAERDRAQRYFLSEGDDHPFSFEAICRHFGWSPGRIRKQLSPQLITLGPELLRPPLRQVASR
ncbi:MAG: hypothetical protein HYR72_00645 [Deltaproteobacteria bacterium]|nr:hypothetical protein [Deltaproteobacteria bacterium]MBI3389462.1 hypothetical protein [Deltaproteobacteria bacterium]